MGDVKWIKIVTDIFDDEKILLIESLPEADSIIVIWFKLLCLAGKQNNSGVFIMSNGLAYTDKMLATIFRRKEATVNLALKTFEEFGMIEIINDAITIPNWSKHQTLDQLEERKEYMREYMKKYREKQKLLTDGENKVNCKVYSKVNVNTLDKEEDIEIEKDKEIYKEIISYLNTKLNSNYKHTTKSTKDSIKARLNEGYTFEDFKTVIDKQYSKWINTDMEQYLRPITLFSNKFESYLNAPEKKGVSNGNTKRTYGSEFAEFS